MSMSVKLFRGVWLTAVTLFFVGPLFAADNKIGTATLDFSRDITPILSNNCYKCHGPDASQRKGGTKNRPLRLDTEDGAYADYAGSVPIVPGHPEKSALVTRITSHDDDETMPPKKSGKQLTARSEERRVGKECRS